MQLPPRIKRWGPISLFYRLWEFLLYQAWENEGSNLVNCDLFWTFIDTITNPITKLGFRIIQGWSEGKYSCSNKDESQRRNSWPIIRAIVWYTRRLFHIHVNFICFIIACDSQSHMKNNNNFINFKMKKI